MSEFYLKTKPDGQEQGPFTGAQLKKLHATGKLKPRYLISRDQRTWKPASQIKGLGAIEEKGADEKRETSPAVHRDTSLSAEKIEGLLKKLRAPSWFLWITKENVIADLGRAGSDLVVEPLMACLDDYCNLAARALAENGRQPERFIPAIVEKLGSSYSTWRQEQSVLFDILLRFPNEAVHAIQPLIDQRFQLCEEINNMPSVVFADMGSPDMSPFDSCFRARMMPLLKCTGEVGYNIAFQRIAHYFVDTEEGRMERRCDMVVVLRELADTKTIQSSSMIRDELIPGLKDLRATIKSLKQNGPNEEKVEELAEQMRKHAPELGRKERIEAVRKVLQMKIWGLPLDDMEKLISRLHQLSDSA